MLKNVNDSLASFNCEIFLFKFWSGQSSSINIELLQIEDEENPKQTAWELAK